LKFWLANTDITDKRVYFVKKYLKIKKKQDYRLLNNFSSTTKLNTDILITHEVLELRHFTTFLS